MSRRSAFEAKVLNYDIFYHRTYYQILLIVHPSYLHILQDTTAENECKVVANGIENNGVMKQEAPYSKVYHLCRYLPSPVITPLSAKVSTSGVVP